MEQEISTGITGDTASDQVLAESYMTNTASWWNATYVEGTTFLGGKLAPTMTMPDTVQSYNVSFVPWPLVVRLKFVLAIKLVDPHSQHGKPFYRSPETPMLNDWHL